MSGRKIPSIIKVIAIIFVIIIAVIYICIRDSRTRESCTKLITETRYVYKTIAVIEENGKIYENKKVGYKKAYDAEKQNFTIEECKVVKKYKKDLERLKTLLDQYHYNLEQYIEVGDESYIQQMNDCYEEVKEMYEYYNKYYHFDGPYEIAEPINS